MNPTDQSKIDDYRELLLARGNVAIQLLTSFVNEAQAILADLRALDDSLDVQMAPADVELLRVLRARFPEFKDKTDAEVLAYFNVQAKAADGKN